MFPFLEQEIIPQDIPFLHIKADFHPVIKDMAYRYLFDDSMNAINLWEALCENPNAIDLLYKNQDKISWKYLSKNPNAIELLKQYPERIDWNKLTLNPNAIQLLEENPSKIYWRFICDNPNAIHLIEKNINHPDLNWTVLSGNPNAMHLLKRFPKKISWRNLSTNPSAVDYLKKHPDKIVWRFLCLNKNKEAMEMLDEYIEKTENQMNDVSWYNISGNPYAMKIIEKELSKKNENARFIKNDRGTPIGSNPAAIHLIIPVMKYGDHAWNISLYSILKNRKVDKLLPYLDHWLKTHFRIFPTGIDRSELCSLLHNPAVFSEREYIYEYDAIRLAKASINESIHQWAGHPKNMHNWKGLGYMEELFEEDDS